MASPIGVNIRAKEAFMLSLLFLSSALAAAPWVAPQATASNDSPLTSPPPLVLVRPDAQMLNQQESDPSRDAMEFHPSSDICYKIRAYIFSTGSNPRFLRETTCGPRAPTAKSTDGFKPRLVPLDVMATPGAAPR
jgi:hypothetical protein